MPIIESYPIYPGMTREEYRVVKDALRKYKHFCDERMAAANPITELARQEINRRRLVAEDLLARLQS